MDAIYESGGMLHSYDICIQVPNNTINVYVHFEK